MKWLVIALVVFSAPAMACEIRQAKLDKENMRYVIPVEVKKGESCIVLNREVKLDPIWNNMEKIGISASDTYGKFFREYKASGDKVLKDKYIYMAGNKAGTEDIRFIAYGSHPENYSTILYKITVK